MIKRFKEPGGRYLTKIIGQDRLAFAMTDTSDLYDLIEWAQRGGYQGSNIQFYDFENGSVYRPFEKKRDVIYADPAYFDGFYYILQGDYADKKVRLYKYMPEEVLELITELNLDEVDLFNMRLAGDKIHIISQGRGMFNCYYPEKFSFSTDVSDSDYKDVLGKLKHTLSTYERTPESYKSMQEEDLRNTLLATLNATYKGAATGETFRRKGKTDICIEQANRAAFVAECKIWKGAKVLTDAVAQLDGYLTWRDCKTALIVFVRQKDFIKVLEKAKDALINLENMRSLKELDKNEFECVYISDSHPGQLVKMRVMLFDLSYDE